MAPHTPDQFATTADLDQTEICQLKHSLAEAQAKIKHLEELEELDQTQIVLLQARIDELTQLVKSLQTEIRGLEEENAHLRGETEEDSQNHDLSRPENTDVNASSGPASPVEDEGVTIDLNALGIDDAAEDGRLSVSDSGFEGYGSDGGSNLV